MHPLILYIALGCGYCAISEQDLAANCIPYTISQKAEPHGINSRPVLEEDGILLLGSDQIHEYAITHNNCRR